MPSEDAIPEMRSAALCSMPTATRDDTGSLGSRRTWTFTPCPSNRIIEVSMPAGRMSAVGRSPAFTSSLARARVSSDCAPPEGAPAGTAVVINRRLESASSAAISSLERAVFDSSTIATLTRLMVVIELPPLPPKITAKIEKNAIGTTNANT